MNEHLRQTEQYLRSLSKKYKSIKFSIGMVILFLMMGVGAFSEEVSSTQKDGVLTREFKKFSWKFAIKNKCCKRGK